MSVMPSREALVRAVSDELGNYEADPSMKQCRRVVDVVLRELGGVLDRLVAGEPYFVLRAHDAVAHLTVLDWIDHAAKIGVPAAKQDAARFCALAMAKWQDVHGVKIPD